MRPTHATALFVSLLAGPACAGAQALDDALVPRGHVRLGIAPVFTAWSSRFGRTPSGVERREALGEDLTVPSAELLFPGAAALRAAVEAMSGQSPYVPVLGETTGRVSKDVTRVELGTHVGVLDWLAVGLVVPWARTRTNVDIGFRADTTAVDLGLNPGPASAAAASFLQALAGAEASARANAARVCGSQPASPSCVAATALADRTASFRAAALGAYDASAFFPLGGSSTAAMLQQATAALSDALVAAGLPAITAPMAFATQRVDERGLAMLSQAASSGVGGAALGDVRTPWRAGDVEVSLTARVLQGPAGTRTEGRGGFAYRVLATLLGRLPTGWIDDPDVFLDVGSGDGQLDLEARVSGALALGTRMGFLAGARYGLQMPRKLVRRVAPPEVVLPARSTRQLVEWDPGAYWSLEFAPALQLSDELSVGGEYRVFRKHRDRYELVDSSVGAAADPAVLEVESGVTLHEAGLTLRYETTARWLAGGTARPLELRGRLSGAVAGGGGQTPVTTRVDFSVRLFQRVWGPH
jgi:hypothetical protein